MKEILLNRCEANGTDDYYLQGISNTYNFEHKVSEDIVYVFSKGVKVAITKDTDSLTKFINSIAS